MLKPLTCAAILATTFDTCASFRATPVDVAAFSAAMAGLPSLHELHREQASGDLRGFAAAMRRAMDVATAVAERDYPQLGAGWNACQSHMITRDGGLTYQFEPSYPNACNQISDRLLPIAGPRRVRRTLVPRGGPPCPAVRLSPDGERIQSPPLGWDLGVPNFGG
jgi:hypothetical protein